MPDPRDSSPERTPVDPTPVRSATPGRRGEMPSDARITSRIAPRPDPTPAPLPPSPAAADAAQWLARAHATSDPRPPAPSTSDLTAAIPHGAAPTWLFPLLLAVTALAVGMVLGALLFGHRAATCPKAHGVQGSSSPTSSSRADEVTALYTAIDRRSR